MEPLKRQEPSELFIIDLACIGNLGGLGNCIYQLIFAASLADKLNGELVIPSEWNFLHLFNNSCFRTQSQIDMFKNSNLVSDKILFGHIQFTQWLSLFPHVQKELGVNPSGRGLRRLIPQLSKISDFDTCVKPYLKIFEDKQLISPNTVDLPVHDVSTFRFQLWGWFQASLKDSIGITSQKHVSCLLQNLFEPTSHCRIKAKEAFDSSIPFPLNEDYEANLEYCAESSWIIVHCRNGDFNLQFSTAIDKWDKQKDGLEGKGQIGPPFNCSTHGWADSRGVFGEGRMSISAMLRMLLNEIEFEVENKVDGLFMCVQGGWDALNEELDDETTALLKNKMKKGLHIRISCKNSTADMDWSFMRLHTAYLLASRNSTFGLSAATVSWLCGDNVRMVMRPNAEGNALEKVDLLSDRPVEGGKKDRK